MIIGTDNYIIKATECIIDINLIIIARYSK